MRHLEMAGVISFTDMKAARSFVVEHTPHAKVSRNKAKEEMVN